MRKATEFLSIKNYIGTELEILDGKYTGKILGDIVYVASKVNFINKFIKNNKFKSSIIWAYTDHISDLPMLLMAGRPCVVNPDNSLLKEARKRNWEIINF